MKHLIITTLAMLLLLLPSGAWAGNMSSAHYTSEAGRVVSGGSAAADGAGMNKYGIAIGQGVFIPAGGSTSPGYAGAVVSLASPQPGGIHTGDINGDGVVDIVDALLALKTGLGLVQLSSAAVFRGDVSPLVRSVPVGDGQIDIEDTVLILRKAVGLAW